MPLTIKDFKKIRAVRKLLIFHSLLDEPEDPNSTAGTIDLVFYSSVLNYKNSPTKSKLTGIHMTFIVPVRGAAQPNPFALDIDRQSASYLAFSQQPAQYARLAGQATNIRRTGTKAQKVWLKLTALKRKPPSNIFDFLVEEIRDRIEGFIGWYEPNVPNPDPNTYYADASDATKVWFNDLKRMLRENRAPTRRGEGDVFNLVSLGLE